MSYMYVQEYMNSKIRQFILRTTDLIRLAQKYPAPTEIQRILLKTQFIAVIRHKYTFYIVQVLTDLALS